MDYENFASLYIDEFHTIMAAMDKKPFAAFCRAMLQAYEDRKTIYILGNGGSAATAAHGVCDINKGVCLDLEKKFKMISLADNISMITAIANDLDYSRIFVEQLKNFLEPGDLVLAISGSGNSANVIHAADYARQKGAFVIGISGFDGGKLAEKSDIHIHIPIHDMQKVEDGQMMVIHMLMQALRKSLGLKPAGC
ncbi:D-sedoheptulose 7-phosphate isomerase [Desulfobotulus alkaliphilus]|uniref:D-sedoheptulose 7-phosphate isomerase n=1 Tax=Desulfobotulus alkaliphilus TaxID=622671 RepID=A0A562S939_9BACT|nr:SIS domain-containing protein [Desulfobotulus alkaliphilus]TWI77264.1 D-sedoheptulose 7-phosphate isomerase [Desulfobotulus alkaliphilus]